MRGRFEGRIAFVLAPVALLAASCDAPRGKSGPLAAHIVRFGGHETRWRHEVLIVFRSDDGRMGQAIYLASRVTKCRVGDPVDAVGIGANLALRSLPCLSNPA